MVIQMVAFQLQWVPRSFVGTSLTCLWPLAKETSSEAMRKSTGKAFHMGHFFKTWPKPETTREKPLAPRVHFNCLASLFPVT